MDPNPYHDPLAGYYFATSTKRREGTHRHLVIEKVTGDVVARYRDLNAAIADCDRRNTQGVTR